MDYYGNWKGTVDIISSSQWSDYTDSRTTTSDKYNKKELNDIYSGSSTLTLQMTTTSSSTATKDDGTYGLSYAVTTASSKLKTWKENETYVNTMLGEMSSDFSVSSMTNSEQILVEPIILCQIGGTNYALTLTEIWMVAGSQFGFSSQAKWGGDTGTYNRIATRVNGTFPNNFYVDEENNICDVATDLEDTYGAIFASSGSGSGKTGPSFATLITQAYGMHLIYKGDSIQSPTKLYIDYLSNYADESFDGALNTVSATKNVKVRESAFYSNKAYPDGLHNYTESSNATYLGRTGYTATGYWNTEADGSGYSVHQNTGFASGLALAAAFGKDISTESAAVSVFAQWTPNTYYIKFNSNGGSGSMSTMTMTYDEAQRLTANSFTKTGYTFLGWSTSSSATTVTYDDQQYVKNLTSVNGATVTLYAVWEEGASSQTEIVVNHYKMNTSGTYPNSPAQITTGWYATPGATVALSSLKNTYTGFTYSHGEVDGVTKTTITVPEDGPLEVDLYYSRNQHTVTLNKGTGISSVTGAGTYYYGQSVTINATVSSGYTWSNWSGTYNTTTKNYTFTMPDYDVTDKANATSDTSDDGDTTPVYQITCNQQSGSGGTSAFYEKYGVNYYSDYAATTTITKISVPTRTGYIFGGYYTSTNGNGTLVIDTSGTIKTANTYYTKDTTVYAKWTPITYTVVFRPNGGTGSTASMSMTYDVAKNLTANGFTRTGYTFNEWNTGSLGLGTSYSDEQSVKNLTNVDGDTVYLYAQWDSNMYTITCDKQGGEDGTSAFYEKYSKGFYSKSSAIILSLYKISEIDVPTYDGYSFEGYYTAKNGGGTQVVDANGEILVNSTFFSADTTIYAKWGAPIYKITCDKQGGEDGSDAFYEKRGNGFYSDNVATKTITDITVPTYGENVFKGYYTEIDGGTQVVDATGKIVVDDTYFTADTTIYAQWKSTTYTIKYVLNGGSVNDSNPKAYTKTTPTFTLINPTKSGYTFVGWTEETSTPNWYDGFINQNTGKLGTNILYPNAVYSEPIYLQAGVTYTLTGTDLGKIRWRFYDTNGEYIENGSDDESFTPNQNGYVRILLRSGCDEVNRNAAVITSSGTWNPMSVPKGSSGNKTFTAVWMVAPEGDTGLDEPPIINAVDRWFTLDEAQNGVITLENLLYTASAVDSEVGDFTDFAAGEGEFTIIDFDAEEFKKFTTSGSTTVTYQAIDKAGNETYRTVTVHIVDKDKEVDDVVTRFTRFISGEYFKDKDGNFVVEDKGGLGEDSVWVKDAGYSNLLTEVLANTQDDAGAWSKGVYATFTFTPDEVVEAKEYIETNGLGNSSGPGKLIGFYNQFKD